MHVRLFLILSITAKCRILICVKFLDKPVAEGTSDHSKDNIEHLDSNELLDNLKTVLQLKTSNLEQKLSDESSESASKLFDSIYRGDNGVNSSNTSKTGDNKFLSNVKYNADNVSSVKNATEVSKMYRETASNGSSKTDGDTKKLKGKAVDQTIVSTSTGFLSADKRVHKSENVSMDEKIGTFSEHLKNINTTDLEQLSDLIGDFDDVSSSSFGDNSSHVSNEMLEAPVKSGQADIFGKVDVDGPLLKSSLRGSHAWTLRHQHENKSAKVLPSHTNNAVTKFDSIFVDSGESDVIGGKNNGTTATEISTQNAILNNPASSTSVDENQPTLTLKHAKGEFLHSESDQSVKPNTSLASASIPLSEKLMGTEKSRDDSILDILHQHGHHVDDHVRLKTASVSTTVNGTSLSSVMGVIRYDDDSQTNKGLV